MFRARNIRRGLGAAAILALAACSPGVSRLTDDSVTVRVAGQRVNLAAPDGFCFDRRSTDVNSAGAFALAGDCSVTTDAPAAGPGTGAFITVSVSNSGLPEGLDTLEGFLRSAPGTSTLGKSGDPDAVTLLETRQADDILFVKVRDAGEQPVPGASGTFWRGFFETADRLVGLSVVGFSGATLSDERSIGYLSGFAERTRAANPVVEADAPAAEPATEETAAQDPAAEDDTDS